jgi:hypothetical protein
MKLALGLAMGLLAGGCASTSSVPLHGAGDPKQFAVFRHPTSGDVQRCERAEWGWNKGCGTSWRPTSASPPSKPRGTAGSSGDPGMRPRPRLTLVLALLVLATSQVGCVNTLEDAQGAKGSGSTDSSMSRGLVLSAVEEMFTSGKRTVADFREIVARRRASRPSQLVTRWEFFIPWAVVLDPAVPSPFEFRVLNKLLTLVGVEVGGQLGDLVAQPVHLGNGVFAGIDVNQAALHRCRPPRWWNNSTPGFSTHRRASTRREGVAIHDF